MTTNTRNRKAGPLREKARRRKRNTAVGGVEDRAGQTPYLILTMRRTGGTSLMGFLSRVSAFPSIQHEPFNNTRAWSDLTTEFVGRYDSDAFTEALSGVLGERPNIKHCLELVPIELTTALIRICADLGYRVFVLSRRHEASRLRSLLIARATGVWGSRQATKKYPEILAGDTKLPPVDLKLLKRRARRDSEAIAAVRDFLRAQEIEHAELAFEDVYAKDGGLAARARQIAAGLGIQVAPDDPHLDQMMASGNFSSAEIFRLLPNAAEFEMALDKLIEQTDRRQAR